MSLPRPQTAADRLFLLLLRLEGEPSSAGEIRGLLAAEGGAVRFGMLRGLLQEHGLAPWCCATLAGLGMMDAFPKGFAEALMGLLRASSLANHRRLAELDRVARLLQEGGVTVIALKGAALAEPLYGRPGLRPMSDLDLLVAPKDVELAERILAPAGFLLPDRLDAHDFREHHYHLPLESESTGETLELHWRISDDPRNSWEEGIWERALPTGRPGVLRLDPASEFVHLAVHAARHAPLNRVLASRSDGCRLATLPGSGNRLIWLLDLWKLMRVEGGPGGEAVMARSREWSVIREVVAGVALAQGLFGAVEGWAGMAREAAAPRGIRGFVLRRLAEGLARGAGGEVASRPWLLRMDPFLHIRPIRALDLTDRILPGEADLARWRASHGSLTIPFHYGWRLLAGSATTVRSSLGLLLARRRAARRWKAPANP
jgi:hypothetical protein